MKKKIIALILACAVLTSVFTACGNTKDSSITENTSISDNNGTKIELTVGESYMFNDAEDGQIDQNWTFESDNEDVAYVMAGKYIYTGSAGTANITVNKGDSCDIYNVVVTEPQDDSDRLLKVDDIRDINVYLGAGFNAFESDQFVTNDQLILGRTIIKSDIINEEFVDDSSLIIRAGGDTDKFLYIEGESKDSYSNNYNKTIEGALSIDVKNIVKGAGEGKFVDSDSDSKAVSKAYTTVFSYNQKYIYVLNADEEELRNMAKQNKSAWKTLNGTNGATPEEVFEKYGTHIITQATIGGRLELDTVLSSTDENTSSQDLLKIAGNLKVQVSVVEGEASASYSDETIKELNKKNATMTTSVKVYGGDSTQATLITDLDSFTKVYPKWYDSLNSDNPKNQNGELLTFIGTTQAGLIPIWELIPDDTEEGIARRNELIEYYNSKMSDR